MAQLHSKERYLNTVDGGSMINILLWVSVMLVLPNLLFLLAGEFLFIERPYINIDYLLAGLVALYAGRIVGSVLLVLILSMDLVFSLAPAYHFSISSVLSSLEDAMSIGADFLITKTLIAISVIVLITGVFFKVVQLPVRRYALFSAVVLTVMLVSFLDVAVNHDSGFSTSKDLMRAIVHSAKVSDATTTYGVPAATEGLRNDLRAGAVEDTVVVVVMESMGKFRSDELTQFQLAPLLALSDREGYEVNMGSVEFSSSTVPGEVRELCGARIESISLPDNLLTDAICLPHLMRDKGYSTTAYHGFLGTFFGRSEWYPDLGFERVVFAADAVKQDPGMRRCGTSFNGICDRDMWKMVVRDIDSNANERQFVYWLTLTAHLPVPDLETSTVECESIGLLELGAVCDLVNLHNRLSAQIAKSLEHLPPSTRLLVVGDHMPPFLSLESRALFDDEEVPFVEIRKRAVNQIVRAE